MQEIDKLKEMNVKQLARWICSEIMNDECDRCPLSDQCGHHDNPIEKILSKEVYAKKTKACITCKHVLDIKCKGNGKESCILYESRESDF